MIVPRSFATLEDDTEVFLLAQKSDMLATRARKKAFGVGRKMALGADGVGAKW